MQRKLLNMLLIFLIAISQSLFPKLAFAETAGTNGTANDPLQIQLLEKVTDQTTVINGITFPNATVKVEDKTGTLLNSTQADTAGRFGALIPKQPANTILKITADDGSGNTYSLEVTVAGWVEESGHWYYYGQNGERLTGWITDNGNRYYLDQTGAMQTGWFFNQGKWYFLKNSGAMQTGWLYDKNKWYYLDGSGVMATGWVLDAGKWYYLHDSGAMAAGWVKASNRWYYLNSSGVMQTGWLYDNGKWYYLTDSGVMAAGWVKVSDRWYYFNGSGAMQTGWLYNGGKWYYLNGSGAMATGWLLDGVKWYYLNSDGTMKTGWLQSGSDWYDLGGSGAVSGVQLDAPLIAQMPELPRGCEVTSLAMLLQDAGVQADKMTLASQVRRDPTPYSKANGQVYFGNPYSGFVGDMYTFSKPGLGVYHGPIAELAEKYLPNRVIDFTGSNFEEIYKHLNNGKPVWVIVTSWYDTVPSQYWETWNTPAGKISITYKEHSVLVTGYDSQYIYFNDPLSVTKNRKVAISAFKRGWEQMGKQAITYR
ncbi:C39 family peptidase [Neobacillus sp. NPDC097160]|uniref:C39 family peptidase n=1 Tax=Neobacillus sp. NPDC097160 TaxID=3364298 RepID=UPI003816C693